MIIALPPHVIVLIATALFDFRQGGEAEGG